MVLPARPGGQRVDLLRGAEQAARIATERGRRVDDALDQPRGFLGTALAQRAGESSMWAGGDAVVVRLQVRAGGRCRADALT